MKLASLALVLPLVTAACSAPGRGADDPASSGAAATATPSDVSGADGPAPAGEPTVVAEGLDAPWSVLRLEDWTLVSQRDAGNVMSVSPDGDVREAVRVDGVSPSGEGGLLGLARATVDEQDWLYAYYTSGTDNRIVRYELSLGDRPVIGEREDVLTGIPRSSNHNGGRIAFGPDGKLYATTGDAGQSDAAQDPGSLAGKILRLEPDGSVPADNPGDSPVYSLGHRNPQGLAWDEGGQLWAAEFGQDTYDELNKIVPGGNYGWPEVEGAGAGPEGQFEEPAQTWATSEASPSGLANVGGRLFLAGLGGQRLFGVAADGASARQYLVDEVGRIRDVGEGPDGTLWVLTNNTDGRGQAREGDDQLLQYRLS